MASYVHYDHEAVQIATCYSKENISYLKVDLPALRQIIGKASDKLIEIVCIYGEFRQGKSFLVNLFLQYLENGDGETDDWIETPIDKSFTYKNTADSVTAGLWIWSEPYIIKGKDGREVAVFLMDSQGWHDRVGRLADIILLFGLSSLLSSIMIFNVKNHINESHLQYLQNFAFNAKCVDKRTADEPFQKLIVSVRDWQFGDYPPGFYDNCTIDGKDYVKDKLRPNSSDTPDSHKLRELIHSAYAQVSACLLPYPGQIVMSDQYDIGKMDKTFRATVVSFIHQLFSADKLVPKKLGGNLVTGTELFDEVKDWINTFNTENNRSIPSYLEANQTKFTMAKQRCLDYYGDKMRRLFATVDGVQGLSELLNNIKSYSKECQQLFDGNQELEQLDKKLKKKVSKMLAEELTKQEVLFRDNIQSKLDLEAAREQSEQQLQVEKQQVAQEMERNRQLQDKVKDLESAKLKEQNREYQQKLREIKGQQEESERRHQREMEEMREELRRNRPDPLLGQIGQVIRGIILPAPTLPSLLTEVLKEPGFNPNIKRKNSK